MGHGAGTDQVDDLDAALALPGHGAAHLEDLAGAGEPELGGSFDRFDGAGHGATVGTFGAPLRRHVQPRPVSYTHLDVYKRQAFSCIAAEFIVGLSAMHSGWFPAFATALIFLTLGMFMGFPPIALALLVGFIAAGGPAFADAGYDFKAGWLLRRGRSREMELDGRREQLFAGVVGMVVAFGVVAVAFPVFFANNQFPPCLLYTSRCV